jgi:biopolymer transport protein TolQ
MPNNPIDAVALGGAAPHDLSVLGLFLQADIIVKVVMLLLLLASFWSWAVIFDKLVRLRRLRRDAVAFEESFWSGG